MSPRAGRLRGRAPVWCAASFVVGACSSPASEPPPAGHEPAAAAAHAEAAAPKSPTPRPVAPWLAGFDEAAARPRFDAMRRSPALRCVIDTAVRERETTKLLGAVADEAPGVVLRAIAEAVTEHPGVESFAFEPKALATSALLERGRIDDGRILLETSEARDDLFYVEHRAALGMPYESDSPRVLHIVTELALAGRQLEAERVYAERVAPQKLEPYELEHHVQALVALGRFDDATALIAAEPPERQWLAHRAWMRSALRRGGDVGPSVERMLAARTARGVHWVADAVIIQEVIRFARGRGLGHLIAPLRRSILDDLDAAELDLETEFVLAHLADEIFAHGDPVEITALGPVLARSDMNVWKRYVAGVRALHHDSLPRALDAVVAIDGASMSLSFLRLWVRHAVAGLDPSFDATFVAKACPPRPPGK